MAYLSYSAWRNYTLLGAAETLEGAVKIASNAVPQHFPRPSGDMIRVEFSTRKMSRTVLQFPESRERQPPTA